MNIPVLFPEKAQQLLKYTFLFLLWISQISLPACTIFIANDGSNVWIGNNEDGLQNLNYRIWYYPARKSNFAYSIWTELPPLKILHAFAYLNPQGGLNEHGLFMDYTAIDGIEANIDPEKTNRKKQVLTQILKHCKTVEEALNYLKQYNLIRLISAQLFIADASGDYATLTGAYVVRRTDPNFALTNYCVNNGHREACHRRAVAEYYLSKTKTVELEGIKAILEKSTQKAPNNLISNYSMAINLKSKTIHLFYKNDFTRAAILSLSAELKKGKRHADMMDYFPKSIAPVIEKTTKNKGIHAALAQYTTLRQNSDSHYNFTNDDALNLSIKWIEKGQINDALNLLECLQSFDLNNFKIWAWLGVVHRKNNDIQESEACFSKVLSQKPDDYLATLYGRQDDQTVTFKLNDFEGAEQVFLMGDFTEWTKHPILMKKENTYWTCTVSLPPGENSYKFIVNKQYLADHENFLHTGSGPDVYSKLYVW